MGDAFCSSWIWDKERFSFRHDRMVDKTVNLESGTLILRREDDLASTTYMYTEVRKRIKQPSASCNTSLCQCATYAHVNVVTRPFGQWKTIGNNCLKSSLMILKLMF